MQCNWIAVPHYNFTAGHFFRNGISSKQSVRLKGENFGKAYFFQNGINNHVHSLRLEGENFGENIYSKMGSTTCIAWDWRVKILGKNIYSKMGSTTCIARDWRVKILGKHIYSKMGSTMCIAWDWGVKIQVRRSPASLITLLSIGQLSTWDHPHTMILGDWD